MLIKYKYEAKYSYSLKVRADGFTHSGNTICNEMNRIMSKYFWTTKFMKERSELILNENNVFSERCIIPFEYLSRVLLPKQRRRDGN